jgi:aminoglycoside phosphotransferase (APT) family kinase protein
MEQADSAFDPDDTVTIGSALERFLSARFGTAELVDGPDRFGSGMDTYVYAIRLRGSLPGDWTAPLVLRVYPNAQQKEKARREAAAQTFAADKGISVPRPLLVEPSWEPYDLPFMIMERIPGSQLVDRFKNPLRLRSAISAMADLQVRLHAVPTQACPLPYDGPLVDRWLAPAKENVEKFKPVGLDRPLRWLEQNADLVRDEEPVLVHNDFHPLNLLADGDRLTLLDWPDATLGDRHCDVARTLALFWLAAPLEKSLSGRTVLGLLRRYIVPAYEREYRKRHPLDRARLRYWQALHAFTSWAQVAVMMQEGEAAIGARAGVLSEIPPGLIKALAAYFEERAQP